MPTRLSDYSPAQCSRVYRCVTLEIAGLLEAETRTAPISTLAIQRVFRLPHLLIVAGVEFARDFAACCREKAANCPGRPLPDPWGSEAEAEMLAAVGAALGLIREGVVRNWGFPRKDAGTLADIALAELRQWIAEEFEDGRDASWLVGKPQDVFPAGAVAEGDAQCQSPGRAGKGRAKKRGLTTEERLTELMATAEGRERVLAAGSASGIARLIERSRASVKESPVWKKSVLPLLESARCYAKLARQERDAHRRY
jgi:hypothetical protein